MATTIAAPVLVFLVVAPMVAFAATFQVDWSLTTDYSSWPSKAVNVGDEIVFTYGPSSHSVLVVSKTEYANCDTSNPSFSDASGSTTYKLKQAGAVYFICGIPGHCPAMQLQLNVKASSGSGSSPTPPSTPGSPPSPSSSSPTPPSALASPPSSNTTPPTYTADSPATTSSSSPPPPSPATSSEKNGAACSGVNSLAFGFLLVFGTLFLS